MSLMLRFETVASRARHVGASIPELVTPESPRSYVHAASPSLRSRGLADTAMQTTFAGTRARAVSLSVCGTTRYVSAYAFLKSLHRLRKRPRLVPDRRWMLWMRPLMSRLPDAAVADALPPVEIAASVCASFGGRRCRGKTPMGDIEGEAESSQVVTRSRNAVVSSTAELWSQRDVVYPDFHPEQHGPSAASDGPAPRAGKTSPRSVRVRLRQRRFYLYVGDIRNGTSRTNIVVYRVLPEAR